LPKIAGRHVLVVDDTWVSGGKAQSAALALKLAGAARVTIVCIGRLLSYRWDEHRLLIDSLSEPYDAMRCPVTGSVCPTG
jgi:phosphoribosylpyrophosphate synthetase